LTHCLRARDFDRAAAALGLADQSRDYELLIGIVALMFKISKLRLRLYEWRGLIKRASLHGRPRQ